MISVELESLDLYNLIEEIDNRSTQKLAFEKLDNIKEEYGRLKQEIETLRESLQSEIEMLTHNRNEIMKENTRLRKIINNLKDKIQFEDLGEMQSGNVYRGYFNDCFDEEEYALLEEEFNKNE